MKICLTISSTHHLTAINAYAPTLTSSDEDKVKFYEDIGRSVKSIPDNDKLILLHNCNTRVGSNSQCWELLMGPHGIGKINSNGLLLWCLCVENDLTIINTFFRLVKKYKTVWMHPRCKEWHLIDYVIVHKWGICDVKIMKAILVRLTFSIHVASPQQRKHRIARISFNTEKLKCPNTSGQYQAHPNGLLTGHGPLI